MSILRHISPLTTDERMQCEMQAKDSIRQSLEEPMLREVKRTSAYPPELIKWVWRGMAVVFIASALPSFFRLFTAGRDYFLLGINDHWQATVVGFSTFLLAEFLIVLSTVASRVLFAEGNMRRLFYVPMGIGFAIALEGNRIIEKPHDLFGWLMTIAPPVAVLSIALITEHIVLDSMKAQHEANADYEARLAEYQEWYNAPQNHKRFMAVFADNITQALASKNASGAGAKERKELMQSFTAHEWSMLVKRELMRRDGWYREGVDVDDVGDAPMRVAISRHRAVLGSGDDGGGVQSVQNAQNAHPSVQNAQMHNAQSLRRSATLEKAIEYIKNNPDDTKLTIRQLAEKAGVSTGTINNAFKVLRGEIEL